MPRIDKLLVALILITAMLVLGSCSRNRSDREHEESGMFSQKIRLRTLPTKAKIFINDREIGESPLTYTIRHEERRMLNIKAVPIYPNQYTQNIFLMVPPIPKTMTIYMNHYPEDYDRNKDKPFTPPEKPLPEVIVKTEIDTVIIERHTKEFEHYTLPVIFFDTASFAIKASEEPKLMPLIDILKKDQSLHLDVYGFADVRASDEYNITLTINRANSVKDFLVKNGISEKRISSFGHGKIAKVVSDGVDMDLSESRKVLFLLKKGN